MANTSGIGIDTAASTNVLNVALPVTQTLQQCMINPVLSPALQQQAAALITSIQSYYAQVAAAQPAVPLV